MTRYIVRRLAMTVLILWFISILVFVLMRVGPGDPALLQQGINATPEKVAQVHKEMGLDNPVSGPICGLAEGRRDVRPGSFAADADEYQQRVREAAFP